MLTSGRVWCILFDSRCIGLVILTVFLFRRAYAGDWAACGRVESRRGAFVRPSTALRSTASSPAHQRPTVSPTGSREVVEGCRGKRARGSRTGWDWRSCSRTTRWWRSCARMRCARERRHIAKPETAPASTVHKNCTISHEFNAFAQTLCIGSTKCVCSGGLTI